MYKVLLVDDEVLIREAIAENISWNSLGFEKPGLCENGKEAIEYIKSSPPDLVLTDICMPYMDGLELAKYIYENCENVKVVIISGYDNFEYAKGAIQYQVMEYILKPVTALELSDTLKKVKTRLDDEQRESRQIDSIKEAYQKSMPVLKERYLNQMIHGKGRLYNVEESLKGYGIELKGALYCVVQIECAGSDGFSAKEDSADELTQFAVFNVASEMNQEDNNCVVFQDTSNITTMIVAGESEYHLEKRVSTIYSNIKEYLVPKLHIHTMTIAGRCVERLKSLYLSYNNLVSAREYRFLFENDSLLFGRECAAHREEPWIDAGRWAERMHISMKQNNEEQIGYDIKDFFQTLKKSYVTKERIVAGIQEVIRIIMGEIEEDALFKKEQELYEELKKDIRLDGMEAAVREYCQKSADSIAAVRENMGQTQAAKALEYIENNYKNPNISLNSVCKYLAMSTSYFSVIFKNHTGITFIEALTKKRMEKAKELLEVSDLKAYQVAEEVGYTDPHYFSSTFKKYVGETPKEYSKKRR